MNILDYIKMHTVLSIGICLDGYVCCETIVDNPKELVSLLKINNCYISEIRWWDHLLTESVSTMGYGGPIDPLDQRFYYAETDLLMKFKPETSEVNYIKYLEDMEKIYSSNNLFPAFDIKWLR